MAATVTVQHTLDLGGTQKLYAGTIALDSSYPTGGEALDVSGNESFDVLIASSTSGYVFSFAASSQKLLAYVGDNDAASDGPLAQVANTTDLSALTAIPFIAIGS